MARGPGVGVGGSEFVRGVVGSGDVDVAGGGVEADSPLSFVDSGVVPPA